MAQQTTLLLVVMMLQFASGNNQKGCAVTVTFADGSKESRECIVEGEGRSASRDKRDKESIGAEFEWMKDTRWHWNNWRDVVFRADGSFLAPAEGCEVAGNPSCRWFSDEDQLLVRWGSAGIHRMTKVDQDSATMSGFRESDGQGCHAFKR